MAAQTVTLQGKKYQLIPIEKGTKAPQGVETIQWTDGKDYILSPVVATPAQKAEVKKEEQKAPPVNTEKKENPATPWWVWALLIIGIVIAAILLANAFRQPAATPATASDNGGNTVARFCNAVLVGEPVTQDGECKFCTINYAYDPSGKNPGDVYIVEEKPMNYKAGAYVYQYAEDRFGECVRAQSFMVDPGYKPIWPDGGK